RPGGELRRDDQLDAVVPGLVGRLGADRHGGRRRDVSSGGIRFCRVCVSATTAGWVELSRGWKKFRYGEVHARLRDVIPSQLSRAFGRRDPDEGLWTGEFWALRDVSFAVSPGQALGLIGPNGAGKSTLLKLLIGILRPTSGRCTLRGRVGTLIEVAA